MKMYLLAAMGGILVGLVVGCDSGTTAVSTTAPASKVEAMKQDIQQVGHDIKVEAQAAASQVGPAWDKTKEETRDLLHRAATKVADATTGTQPGTTTTTTVTTTMPQ